jgi:hypothetical protein
MRLRWTIIPVFFVAAVVAIYNVCHQSGGPVDTIVGMARRISFGALYAIGFWAASHVLNRWMSQPVAAVVARAERAAAGNTAPPAAPIPTFASGEISGAMGQYRVHGVDVDSQFEITEVVFADSPSSAQLKVELKGVQVAAVERAF